LTHIKWISQLIIILAFIGCATVQWDWENAQSENTVQAYQEFIEKHPSSEWTDIAKHKMEEADWERAESLDITQMYEEFLAKYPSSDHADVARQKTEKLDWSKAEKTSTIQAYQQFLAKHPSGEFAQQAKHNIEEIDWENAKNINTNSAYEEFLTKYPSGSFARKALKEIKVPQGIIEKIPRILDYEGSDVFISYKVSAKVIEVIYKNDKWRFVKSDIGYKIEPGAIIIVGKAKANTKLKDSHKGTGVIRGAIKHDKKGIPYAGKDGVMLYIEDELK
jgi:outer membrane protein assembly factor BamD (BamD/ComL family)